MSDQTIDQLRPYLKSLNDRIEKLSRTIDQLEILVYRYQRLSYQLNQIDVLVFEIKRDFDQLHELCRRGLIQNADY